jgi:hypothetical protein
MKQLTIAAPPECFWINNGPIVCDLRELYLALKDNVSDAQFFHHVTKEKNDFEQWIRVTLRDDPCALKVKKARARDEVVQILRTRLRSYEE